MSSVTHAAGADLEVGDVVVSPRHGPGKITDRGVRTVAEARDEYLTVALERRGITLMIPVAGVARARLRRLASRSTARQALGVLETPPRPLDCQWRDRQRNAAERLGTGDLLDLAALVRDFAHAARMKRPPAGDREIYQTAQELLEAELTAVLGGDAARKIHQRLPTPATDR